MITMLVLVGFALAFAVSSGSSIDIESGEVGVAGWRNWERVEEVGGCVGRAQMGNCSTFPHN
jgi:hypothetical protein